MLFTKNTVSASGFIVLSFLVIGCVVHNHPVQASKASQASKAPDTAWAQGHTFYAETGGPVATDAYKYPIKDPQLRALDSNDKPGERGNARLAACQVPKDILKKMSTFGLVQTALSNPIMIDKMAAPNIEGWFQDFSGKANVFQELYRRPDAGTVFLNREKAVNLGDYKKYNRNSLAMVDYYSTIQNTYLCMAQPQILGKLNHAERVSLAQDIMIKLKEIDQKYDSIYRGESYSYIEYPLLRLMQLEQYKPLMDEMSKNECFRNHINNFGSGGFCSMIPPCQGSTVNLNDMRFGFLVSYVK